MTNRIGNGVNGDGDRVDTLFQAEEFEPGRASSSTCFSILGKIKEPAKSINHDKTPIL